jgi:S-DNA-T family DNA segregation ATPase FtsK/SpoIIIE
MAKADSPKSRNAAAFEPPKYRPRWVSASLCFLLSVLLFVAMIDYQPEQSSFVGTTPTAVNLVGWVGADTAFLLFRFTGGAAWLVAFFFLWLGYIFLKGLRRLASARIVGMVICTAAGAGLAAMQEVLFSDEQIYNAGPGGLMGAAIYDTTLRDAMGVFGSGLLLLTIYVLSLMFVLTRDIGAQFDRFFAWFQELRERWRKRREERRELNKLKAEAKQKLRKDALAELRRSTSAPAAPPADLKKLTLPKGEGPGDAGGAKPTPARNVPLPPPRRLEHALSLRGGNVTTPTPPTPPAPVPAKASAGSERTLSSLLASITGASANTHAPTPGESSASAADPSPADEPDRGAALSSLITTKTPAKAPGATASSPNLKIVAPEAPRKAAVPQPRESGNYVFPPVDLLQAPARADAALNEEEHARNAETLLRTLSEFGVEVSLGEIHTGPVITRYEVLPAPGVRVEKIASLDKNIALGMRAQSVRILAPVPGKGVVGVEVPNQNPTPVGLREIIETADWAESKAELPIALGKDVSGTPLVADLARMPHLLIAGATGSGKSVCINSIIASLVYHAGPQKLRMLMIDPKIVELKIYNPLPHMLIPVVTEPKKVPGALKWLLAEMERRYQIFAKVGVRNIASFNNRKPGAKPEFEPENPAAPEGELTLSVPRDDEIEVPDRMHYIVAIIDELADLMMVAPAEIETSIARLAQLARAAGIHLIIATQRPSVNVITGVIKANLPSRIAFQVASKVDSRTILDTGGADQLIGRGDMLFSPPGSSKLIRAQGAFISDDEINAVLEHLKKNGPPVYLQEVQDHVDRPTDGEDGVDPGDEGDDDEMLPQAIEVLKSTRRASTSMLQRRLRIGYNRAARLMELMEQRGIVGPENGAQPREILADLDAL